MAYSVRIREFEGPLDLLLQLVESNEREITTISLIEVTDPFVQYVREHQGAIALDELADFLMVAARLVYLKSKALLPGFIDPELEEGPDLASQLKMYKTFVEAALHIGEITNMGPRSFARLQHPIKDPVEGFVPPSNVTILVLRDLYTHITRRLEPLLTLPRAAIVRVISMEEKIQQLHDRVRAATRMSFHRFLTESSSRAEMVVSFLALLELIKQRSVVVNQGEAFEEISIELSA